LITGKTTAPKDVNTLNTAVERSPFKATYRDVPNGETLAPASIDTSIDKWFYISGGL